MVEALTYNKDMKGEVTADRAGESGDVRGSFCQQFPIRNTIPLKPVRSLRQRAA